MFNPNHTNEETPNQSTKEVPEQRTNKERTGSLGSLPLPQRRIPNPTKGNRGAIPYSIHRSEHQEDKEKRANPPLWKWQRCMAWQQQRTCSTISLSKVTVSQ
jgi:hypothetical protein